MAIITNFSGVSIDTKPLFATTSFSGLSFELDSNFFVKIFEVGTNAELKADITITNKDYPNDDFTNGTAGFEAHEHRYFFDNNSLIQIDVNKEGYQPVSTFFIVNKDAFTTATVFLNLLPNNDFVCNTYIGDVNNNEFPKIIENQENYLYCQYTIPNFTNLNDYNVIFTQYPVEGDKFSGKEMNVEYVGSTGTNLYTWRALINEAPPQVKFTAKIRKIEC